MQEKQCSEVVVTVHPHVTNKHAEFIEKSPVFQLNVNGSVSTAYYRKLTTQSVPTEAGMLL